MGEIMDIFKHKPEIKILKSHTHTYGYMKSGVIISVENGLGALRNELCEDYPDWHNRTTSLNMLTLNDMPILQYDDSGCPTCAGLLAAGYGIENTDCSELRQISEAINADFTDIEHSVEILSPLLGLLETGVYMIADIPHYPTDGCGKFFWNVTSEKTYYDAACDEYYLSDFFDVTDSFPAYLYPTQSTKRYNPQRVTEYAKRFSKSKSRPRAVAYSHYGFMSALLDGHHKACAAALLGEQVNCITIIPIHALWGEYDKQKEEWDSVYFLGNVAVKFDELDISNNMCRLIRSRFPQKDINPYKRRHFSSDIFCGIPDERYTNAAKKYPIMEDMALLKHFEINTVTREMIDKCFDDLRCNSDTQTKLKTIIRTEAPSGNPLARYAAIRILRLSISDIYNGYPIDDELNCEAVLALKFFKDEEIEQLMIDLLVHKGLTGRFADLVKSYWD